MIPWACSKCHLVNQWCHKNGAVRRVCFKCGEPR